MVSLSFGLSLLGLVGEKGSSAQSNSIFGNATLNSPTGGGSKVTLGVIFWNSQSGTMSAICSSNRYVASLYSAGGTRLGSGSSFTGTLFFARPYSNVNGSSRFPETT